jgi:hypothetical protein
VDQFSCRYNRRVSAKATIDNTEPIGLGKFHFLERFIRSSEGYAEESKNYARIPLVSV